MNREDLEKMFDKKFWINWNNFNFICWKKSLPDEIKDFIFSILISQILKYIIPNEYWWYLDWYDIWYNKCLEDIKQKAKELYNINL